MKKIIFTTILILQFFALNSANSQSIVSGISTNEINIDTKFNGTNILIFGAKGDAGNIIIAVRGPKKNFLVTKKDKTFGIWHNGKRIEFEDFSSYYSIFSTFEDSKSTGNLLSKLELGTNNLQFKMIHKNDKKDEKEFTLQLIENLEKEKLYSIGAEKIDFLNETLFKVILHFPKNISRGIYTVEIYLINEVGLISFQSIPIYVKQVGISAKIFDSAYQQPFLYGIFSVIIALVIGFLANFIFARFLGK